MFVKEWEKSEGRGEGGVIARRGTQIYVCVHKLQD